MKFSRRSALKMGAVPVVVSAVPAAGAVPVNHIRHDGRDWPVNAPWHAENTAPFPQLAAMSIDELEAQVRDRLYKIADARNAFGGRLTVAERKLLVAGNRHRNVRAGIVKLKGRPLSEFGFTGYDQVTHSSWRLRCGCEPEHVFDAHLARAGVHHEKHPHFPLFVCEDHTPLVGDDVTKLSAADLRDLHGRLWTDHNAAG